MSADLDYRPRPRWTDPETVNRRVAPFTRRADSDSWRRTPMPLSDTERTLRFEADELGAERVVIEVVAPERAFRLDGLMRADARIDHPGVVVSLDSRHGPLRYATDTFTRWQDNLRAVSLALEALRKVDRYGVTTRGEQYTGWKALPPGTAVPMPAAQLTPEQAARDLIELAECGESPGVFPVLNNTGLRTDLFRRAARLHHPDAGGQRAQWDRLEAARRVLDDHGATG